MGYTCRAVGTDHFRTGVVFACVPFPRASRTHAPTAPCLPFPPIHPGLSAMASSSTSSPPSLLIIGTGGTIAGVAPSAGSTADYQAGALPIEQILDSVPGLSALVPEGRLDDRSEELV